MSVTLLTTVTLHLLQETKRPHKNNQVFNENSDYIPMQQKKSSSDTCGAAGETWPQAVFLHATTGELSYLLITQSGALKH